MISRTLPTCLVLLAGLSAGVTGCGPTKAGLEARADSRARLNAYTADFTYDQALQDFESGQFDRALQTVTKAIEQDPEVARFYVLRGRILTETHHLEHALTAFDEAIALDETNAEGHYYSGIVHQRWSDDTNALIAYQKAYDLESDNIQYLTATVEMLIAQDRLSEARTLVTAKLDYFEQDSVLFHLLGQVAMLEGDLDQAADLFAEAVLLEPEDTHLLEQLAWVQFDAERFGACHQTLQTLEQRITDERADLRRLEARCLTMLGRSNEAHSVYMRLTLNQPSDATLWIEFGTLAWEVGDFRRVAQCSLRAITLAPERYEGYFLKGLYEREQGRNDQAIQLLHQAASLAPTESLPFLMLGRALEQAGDTQGAMDAYLQAAAIEPENELAAFLLVDLQQRMYATAEDEE